LALGIDASHPCECAERASGHPEHGRGEHGARATDAHDLRSALRSGAQIRQEQRESDQGDL
jgi:hypothetical protein